MQRPSDSPAAPAPTRRPRLYVLGTGAVGLPLAAFLTAQGREVVAVRTRPAEGAASTPGTWQVTIQDHVAAARTFSVATMPLNGVSQVDGIAIVTVKSHANATIAGALRERAFRGPVVLLQNGLDIERPFLDAGFQDIRRGVLYMTSQLTGPQQVRFQAIASSPLGTVEGDDARLEEIVAELSSPDFAFHAERDLAREVWRKAIVNAVFNSICPLLEIDNGVFTREPAVTALARELVGECLTLADAEGIALEEADLMNRILRISRGSDGVLISTLQDLRQDRETEIDSLHLAMARRAAAHQPPIPLPRIEILGRLILAKSATKRLAPTPQ